MSNFNRVFLVGNLVNDPQLRQTATVPVCEISLIVREWYVSHLQEREEVLHIPCVAFAHAGNSIHKHCVKGDLVLVEGRLRLETWQENGSKYSRFSVVVQNYRLLTPKMEQQSSNANQERKVGQTYVETP